jgi:integrase
MGYAKKRIGRNGNPRYTAVYVDLRGSERSAGTFGSERAANKAWQNAEVELRQGRVGDPARGRQTFQRYVQEQWLPNHVLEPTTREKYTYYLSAYILPALGPMRMTDIFPEHIREWITRLQREGQSAWTIQYCKSSILSSVFTTALNDQVTYIHPCRGVKIPTVPATVRTIVTPEQFDVVYGVLPGADAQLLVETAIESGLRWGELAELRVRDLDIATRMLTVSRKVTEVNREFHPDGRRFLVKLYPKDKEYRRLKLSPDRREAQGPHQGQRPGPGWPAVRPPASCADALARGHRAGSPRVHQAQRRRAPLPARDAQRL